MQPRAMGRRVSDEFAVPLCRTHHRAVHRHGDEADWWKSAGIDPVVMAQRLWQHTRLDGAPNWRSMHGGGWFDCKKWVRSAKTDTNVPHMF
jgi:hypothetical protein